MFFLEYDGYLAISFIVNHCLRRSFQQELQSFEEMNQKRI